MAKLTDKLFNRVIEGEMLSVVSFTEEEFTAGKVDEQLKHVHVGDLIKYNDYFIIVTFNDGYVISGIQYLDDNIIYGFKFNIDDHIITVLEYQSVDDYNLMIQAITTSGLTHSFAELDKTLRALIETAISDGGSVACTAEQWNSIKALLDKSLYLNYDGVSMLKTLSNGIDVYNFGCSIQSDSSFSGINNLTISYYEDTLYIEVNEI